MRLHELLAAADVSFDFTTTSIARLLGKKRTKSLEKLTSWQKDRFYCTGLKCARDITDAITILCTVECARAKETGWDGIKCETLKPSRRTKENLARYMPSLDSPKV